jgi:hypothetical protein
MTLLPGQMESFNVFLKTPDTMHSASAEPQFGHRYEILNAIVSSINCVSHCI